MKFIDRGAKMPRGTEKQTASEICLISSNFIPTTWSIQESDIKFNHASDFLVEIEVKSFEKV